MRKLIALCVFMFAPCAGSAATPAGQQASALFEADWQWRMHNEPEFATTVGDHRFDALLSDSSLAGSRATLAHQRKMLEQARQIQRDKLSEQDLLSYDLFVYEKELAVKEASFYPYQVQPITRQDGIHLRLAQLAAQMPFASEADYRNYLARLNAVPAHVDGLIEQMREGMRSGWTAPRAAVRAVPEMLRQLRENLEGGAIGLPFRQIRATIARPVREALAVAGPAALRTRVAPALQKLEEFIRASYLPAARESIGAASLPGGTAWYALALRRNAGTEMNAAEIHALGLKEVARIQLEIRGAIARTGFSGSFAEFAAFANSDPRLFYAKPEPMLAHYRNLVARATRQLPLLFATLPQEELGVKPAQEGLAEDQGGAYYEAGTPERIAALVVNTSHLETRPRWEMESLALHEGVPGHHLQVARAHELAELPAFRRYGWYVAFGEGWALYAESLGPELGFFKDPFSNFGHLNGELLRAARLVVDTGIHARGWTRQQASDYLDANTANPPADNQVEVDRYIAWPAQALGYKIGQLKIRALREQAEAALGAKFDVRGFHSAVLDNGALPLPLLEQQVARWIAQQRQLRE